MTRAVSATLQNLLSSPTPIDIPTTAAQPATAAPSKGSDVSSGASTESGIHHISCPLTIIEYVIPDSESESASFTDDEDEVPGPASGETVQSTSVIGGSGTLNGSTSSIEDMLGTRLNLNAFPSVLTLVSLLAEHLQNIEDPPPAFSDTDSATGKSLLAYFYSMYQAYTHFPRIRQQAEHQKFTTSLPCYRTVLRFNKSGFRNGYGEWPS